MGKCFLLSQKWGKTDLYLQNYRPSKFLFCFIDFWKCHDKIVLMSKIPITEKLLRMKVNLKLWRFFGPTTVKWQPFEFFAQFHENALFMATIYHFHKYQTLFLVKYIVFSKIPNIPKYGLILTGCFKIWSHKDLICYKRAVENAILLFLVFSIFKFNITFVKSLMKKKNKKQKKTTCTFKVLILRNLETLHWEITVFRNFFEIWMKGHYFDG